MTVLVYHGNNCLRWEEITRIDRESGQLLRLWRGKECVYLGTYVKLEVI